MKEQLKTDNSHSIMTKEPHLILPVVLVQNGRQEFRRVFIEMFPGFIPVLRVAVPQITSSEEILCMLIYLNQSTDDIAAVLSINRKSVNQSRYRLRLKLKLLVHESLEHFVHQLSV